MNEKAELSNEEYIYNGHGPETLKKAKELSNYINSLPLTNIQNNELVHLMAAQVHTAEREQYDRGFSEGYSTYCDINSDDAETNGEELENYSEKWGDDLLQYILSLPQQPATVDVTNQLNEKIQEAIYKKGDEAVIAVVKKARMLLIEMSKGDE